MAPSTPKPLMDPQLRASLDEFAFPALTHLDADVLKMMRGITATPASWLDEQKARGISHKEVRIPSKIGASDYEIVLSILQQNSQHTKPRPCLYWMHGGALHWGDRLHTLEYPTEVILGCDAICISIEYPLAPEYSYSTAAEACYTGLQWVNEHMQELCIDPGRLMVGGVSAGGGLAATVALLCRDRHGPDLCAQCLICPCLDNRLSTVSSHQYTEESDFLTRGLCEDIFKSSLAREDKDPAKRITLAASTEDLSRLPTTYLEAGSAEVFRDETVAYASKLWAAGVQAELNIWPGGFHGFDAFLPKAAVSQTANQVKLAWVKRTLGVI